MLKSQGVNVHTLQDQIASQIAWGKSCNVKSAPASEVTDLDIDVGIAKIAEKYRSNAI